MRIKLLPVAILSLLIAMSGPWPRTYAGSLDQPYNRSITVDTLCDAYEANEVAAEARYKGRQFSFSGEVSEIKKTDADTVMIVLKGPPRSRILLVRCYLDDARGVQRLAAGSSVAMHGTIDGVKNRVLVITHCALK